LRVHVRLHDRPHASFDETIGTHASAAEEAFVALVYLKADALEDDLGRVEGSALGEDSIAMEATRHGDRGVD
jgi:hypothetical protein